jgi:hypothetical protein
MANDKGRARKDTAVAQQELLTAANQAGAQELLGTGPEDAARAQAVEARAIGQRGVYPGGPMAQRRQRQQIRVRQDGNTATIRMGNNSVTVLKPAALEAVEAAILQSNKETDDELAALRAESAALAQQLADYQVKDAEQRASDFRRLREGLTKLTDRVAKNKLSIDALSEAHDEQHGELTAYREDYDGTIGMLARIMPGLLSIINAGDTPNATWLTVEGGAQLLTAFDAPTTEQGQSMFNLLALFAGMFKWYDANIGLASIFQRDTPTPAGGIFAAPAAPAAPALTDGGTTVAVTPSGVVIFS